MNRIGWRLGWSLALLLAMTVACGRALQPTEAPTSPPPASPAGEGGPPTASPPSPPTATVGVASPIAAARPPETPLLDLTVSDFRLEGRVEEVAEIWDYNTGDHLLQVEGRYYTQGGDWYEGNVYERPFTALTQDTYWPDLDIRYARMVRQGPWMYAVVELHGLRPGDQPLAGEYGLELDLNFDGRGDVLLWAAGPFGTEWSWQGVAVYTDPNRDVGDARACVSDAPHRRSNGYERLRWKEGQGDLSGAAWVRARIQRGRPTVEFAFPVAWIAREAPMFLWRVWTDTHVRRPEAMDYHDTFTLEQAGRPYRHYAPINALAESDSTCYTPFGYAPLGLEPCLCHGNDFLHPLCPEPFEEPGDTCESLGTHWRQCQAADGSLRYCHWDPELCRWDCRGTPLCFGTDDPEALARQYQDFLQRLARSMGGEITVEVLGEENARLQTYQCRPEQGEVRCEPVSQAEASMPGELLCVQNPFIDVLLCAPTITPGMREILGYGVWEQSQEEGSFQAPTIYRWYCTWDATLCRYACNEERWCLDPKSTVDAAIDAIGQDISLETECTYDGTRFDCLGVLTCLVSEDGTFVHCDIQSPEGGMEVVEWNYDPETCTFQHRTVCEMVELPWEVCEPVDEDSWLCEAMDCERDPHLCAGLPPGFEPPMERCDWSTALCQWECHGCDTPDDSCYYVQGRTPPWVCPGLGEFDNCRWDEEACRWQCIGIHLPPGGGEEECQPADYCREMVTDIWVCGGGGPPYYKQCTYDGCHWICDGQPVP